MTEPISVAPPTLGRAFGLWLSTVGLGSLFVGLFLLAAGSPDVWIALFAGAIAGGASLPALLFLPASIKWALAAATPAARGGRLFGLITLLFGLAMLVCYAVFHEADLTSTIFAFAAPYFVAMLLAAYFLYHDWLTPSLSG